MRKGRSISSIIWRTVVCVALAPACKQQAAKPAAPVDDEKQATIEEEEEPPVAREELPDCDDLEPLPDVYPPTAEPPPGNTKDGLITVFVTSTPSGADVTFMSEDASRGKTPLALEVPVEEGSYPMISVSLAGYQDAAAHFDFTKDRDQAFNVVLLDNATLAARPRCVRDRPHADFGFIVS